MNWPWTQGFISGLLILFHWSQCLFCWHHIALITVSLSHSLKVWCLQLCAFSRVFFFSWLHMNFRTICLISLKHTIGTLMQTALNLWVALESMDIWLFKSVSMKQLSIYLSTSVSFINVSWFSIHRSFRYILIKFIPRVFHSFWCNCTWDCFFFTSFSDSSLLVYRNATDFVYRFYILQCYMF